MLKNVRNKLAAMLTLGAGASVASLSASAAVDTTSIVATITEAATAAGVIGVAVLSMHYGIKLYKWIKAAG